MKLSNSQFFQNSIHHKSKSLQFLCQLGDCILMESFISLYCTWKTAISHAQKYSQFTKNPPKYMKSLGLFCLMVQCNYIWQNDVCFVWIHTNE